MLISWNVSAKKISPKREMRAVWIATVDNIDWPSKSGLSVAQQKVELIAQLDQLKKNGMNTIVFQIRPAADAFYASPYEPWSQWLSGKQGVAPDPFYDPLQFAIKACHDRAMELHAWMNPYRAVFKYKTTKTDSSHITNVHPEWFLTYGKHKYFNPGLKQTRDYVSKIVADVVRRYNVDAIHFDDYFYPYKIKGEAFPDSLAFAKNGGDFYPDRIEDWRRENVNKVIHQIQDSIKSIKPWLPFGISPFGVWRNKDKDPNGSRTKAGQTNYDDLYADVLLWLQKGWIDYVTPQIYWHIGKKVADYRVIAKWWRKHSYGKPCYIGQGVYRLDSASRVKAWRNSDQIIRQIKLNRRLKEINGSMFFCSKNFRQDRLSINEALTQKVYAEPALHLVNLMFKGNIPDAPIVERVENRLKWNKQKDAVYYVVYQVKRKSGLPQKIICITNRLEYNISKKYMAHAFAVSAVNRGHQESSISKLVEFSVREDNK
ncbi:glycoside hydrolase family 10 protein [Ancylomarina longa]|uniref:Glycoside hydrolase family 10 protein n=1 Tax=Ancylomarina longa TaxID=2487017 RepID=A0A434AF62_9BACT|nr:glycoside hydrolase family 10 protein [Ancylomarina longa]